MYFLVLYKIIHSFIDYLGFDEQLILYLIEYCVSNEHTNMRYIEKVAISWSDKGITDIQSAGKYVQDENKKKEIEYKYKKLFRIYDRNFVDVEKKYIYDWEENLKVPEELVKQALEKSILNTGKISLGYMDAVIKNQLPEFLVGGKNVLNSKYRNYPESFNLTSDEKEMLDKMMADYEGGADNADNE